MDEYKKVISITSPNTQFDIVNDFELTRNKLTMVINDSKQGGAEGGKVFVITTDYE